MRYMRLKLIIINDILSEKSGMGYTVPHTHVEREREREREREGGGNKD